MRAMDEKEERGLAFVTDVLGEDFSRMMKSAAQSESFGADIGRMGLSFAFADAWGHTGLDRTKKSIAILSVLIALRQQKELKNHVKIGLSNGLTVAEFEGLLVQLTPYVGFPCIASATTTIVEALREAGHDPQVETAEEKGLL